MSRVALGGVQKGLRGRCPETCGLGSITQGKLFQLLLALVMVISSQSQ